MANSFVHNVYNVNMGSSKLEADEKTREICMRVVNKAKELNVELVLPTDFVTSTDIESAATGVSSSLNSNEMAMDIGPDSLNRFVAELNKCNTVVWNGPVGMFEKEQFAHGTKGILEQVLRKNKNITSIICGGDTGSAIKKFQGEQWVSHISTGGGASLELLEGKELPGISYLAQDNVL
mmetsp:Transcript_102367/g.220990  ORF Transcript_102367/g.220990 Transcript_102367/m.220990 type:complete len:179 (+) Transcript_102367:743-1279(+)